MALTLILTRHAKSDWDAGVDDFARPLNERGRQAAAAVSRWLRDCEYVPDVVLVSGARRTVETWERMAPDMPDNVTVETEPRLYHASAEAILAVLRGQTAHAVMLIAHNPGIGDFAERIVEHPPDHPKFLQYPTAATTVIRFGVGRWKDVTWGAGTAIEFTVPRDL